MNLRKTVRALWAATVLLGVAGAASAGDVPVSAEQVNLLIQRLQQAEARINSLQTELNGVKSAQSAPPLLPGAVDATEASSALPDGATQASGATLPGGATYRPASAALNAADDAMLERLQTLETKWVDLDKTQAAMTKSLSDVVADGSSNSTTKVTGRIHLDHWAFPGADPGIDRFEGGDPQDRFAFRRVRFGVQGDIKDNVLYKIEMEFANPNSTEFRDVYIGVNDLPYLQTVLVGNQKRPYSLDQLNSSNANVFIERPFIADGDNEDVRRLGIQSWSKSDDLAWNWQYGVFNRENFQNDGSYISDAYQMEVAGRLANTWWYDECSDGRGYGHWAVAASSGRTDGNGGSAANTARLRARPEGRSSNRWLDTGAIAGATSLNLIATEGVLNIGAFQLVGETSHTWVPRNVGPTPYFWGAYGYASYFLTGEHIPWNRETGTLGKVKPFENFFMVDTCDGCSGGGWGAWQVAARYSYADFSDEDILGGIGESVTLGVNWWWNPNTRIQFNYVHGQIRNRAVGLIPAAPAGPVSGDYDILGTRFMVFF